ncbi:MAG: hypothetical protein QM710_11855 [Flavobacterium sp.]
MSKLRNTINGNLNLAVFILLAVVYAISYSCFSIVFDSGDDIAFQKILRGYFTVQPDVHLVFINVMIGYILKPFYIFDNTVYWYSFLMLFLQALSFGIILKIELKKKYSIIYYVVLLLLFQYLIIRLQFTTVSAMLTVAGFLLTKEKMRLGKRNLIFPLLLLVFGFLIREEMFYLIIVFLMAFVFVLKRELLLNSLKDKGYLIQFSALAVVLAASHFFDESHYRSKEWSYYVDYNAVRGPVNDSPMFKAYYEDKFATDTIAKSDLDIVVRNFIALKQYDKDRLNELLQGAKHDKNAFRYRMQCLKMNSVQMNNFILYVFVLFILALAVKERRFSLLIPVILLLLAFVAISLEMTFKNRLSFPILIIFYIFYAAAIDKKWYRFLIISLGVITLFTNQRFLNGFSEKQVEIADLPTDRLIVPLSTTNSTFHPFKLNELNNRKNIVNMGWLAESPLIIDMLKQKNIKVSQHFSLFDDATINSNFYYYIGKESLCRIFNSNLNPKGMKLVPLKNYKDIYTIQKL